MPGPTRLPGPTRRGILLTRPEPGASRTAARLVELGFCPILAPALVIRALPARLPDPTRTQAVLLTSDNALPALPPSWRAHPLFAVGATTAAQARANGFSQIHSADADATALAALVTETCRPAHGALLLLSGRGQGQDLAQTLRAAQFRVIRRAVYAAIPAPALPDHAKTALTAGHITHALFFSAATARVFLRLIRQAGLLDRLRDIEAITIGEPARMALETTPWRRIRVAARPTQDAMLACLT